MKIQVGGLSEGVHEYRFRTTPAELELPPVFRDEVETSVTLEKTSRQLFLRATGGTTADVECDRCVTPFRETLEFGYQMHYVPEEPDAGRVDPSEVQVLPPGSTMIDLSDDVRQSILLAFPLKHVCRDDCKGLCPRCGKNLNEGSCDCKDDPLDGRWDKLKELQNNKPNQAG